MFNRSSDMVVFDGDGSEWVVDELLKALCKACEEAQKGQVNPEEKEKIDRIQEEIEVLMCLLPYVFEGSLISVESLKKALNPKQIEIIKMNIKNNKL